MHNHRLVGKRNQGLGQGECERAQASSKSSNQDQSLHVKCVCVLVKAADRRGVVCGGCDSSCQQRGGGDGNVLNACSYYAHYILI